MLMTNRKCGAKTFEKLKLQRGKKTKQNMFYSIIMFSF